MVLNTRSDWLVKLPISCAIIIIIIIIYYYYYYYIIIIIAFDEVERKPNFVA